MKYQIIIAPPAQAQLRRLDPQIRRRIVAAIDRLADDPRPPGCKKLVGADAWRIRIGDWRVIYSIDDDVLVVVVLRVGHRGDIYD